jgi:two-component system, cell cycle sensor histidine kinase and response regulator CckA
MPGELRVLIVEDSVEDTTLILRELSRDFIVVSERAWTAAGLRAALEGRTWDLVISDYSLPGFGGREALQIFQRAGMDVPFIMVSGVMGEVLAVEMVKAGAHNYVLKHQLDRLLPAVRQELQAAKERRSRVQSDAAANYIASMVESCEEAIISANPDGTIVSWNAGAERLLGYTSAEMAGRSGGVLIPPYRPETWADLLHGLADGGRLISRETQFLRKDQTPVEILLATSPIKNSAGELIGASIVAHDITSHKLDEQDRLTLIQELTAALAHLGNSQLPADASTAVHGQLRSPT